MCPTHWQTHNFTYTCMRDSKVCFWNGWKVKIIRTCLRGGNKPTYIDWFMYVKLPWSFFIQNSFHIPFLQDMESMNAYAIYCFPRYFLSIEIQIIQWKYMKMTIIRNLIHNTNALNSIKIVMVSWYLKARRNDLNRAIQAIKKKNEAILRYLSAHSLRSLEMSLFLQIYLFSS